MAKSTPTDFENTFDRIPYDSAWDTLKCWGITSKIISTIKSFFGSEGSLTGQEQQSGIDVFSQLLMCNKDGLHHLSCLVPPLISLRESRGISGVDDKNMYFFADSSSLVQQLSCFTETKPLSSITKSNLKLIAYDENKKTMKFPAVFRVKIVF